MLYDPKLYGVVFEDVCSRVLGDAPGIALEAQEDEVLGHASKPSIGTQKSLVPPLGTRRPLQCTGTGGHDDISEPLQSLLVSKGRYSSTGTRVVFDLRVEIYMCVRGVAISATPA